MNSRTAIAKPIRKLLNLHLNATNLLLTAGICILAWMMFTQKNENYVLAGKIETLSADYDILRKQFSSLEEDTATRIERLAPLAEFYRTETLLFSMRPWLRKNRIVVTEFTELVYQNAKLYNVDPYLALAIATKESIRFERPNHRTRGTSGELGWYQIMPSTAVWFGYTKDDLKDLSKNVRLGIYYYGTLLKNNQDEFNALREYNGGRMWKKISITEKYASDIFKLRRMYRNYAKGIES